jgi:hypothetical protein
MAAAAASVYRQSWMGMLRQRAGATPGPSPIATEASCAGSARLSYWPKTPVVVVVMVTAAEQQPDEHARPAGEQECQDQMPHAGGSRGDTYRQPSSRRVAL